jgi:hypothetical protein
MTCKSGEELFASLNRSPRFRTHRQICSSDEMAAKFSRVRRTKGKSVHPFLVPVSTSSRSESPNSHLKALQQWVIDEDPTPFEILRGIANVSPVHQNLLTLIADELEHIMSLPHLPRRNNGRPAQISESLLEGYDMQIDIERLTTREYELQSKLEELDREKGELEAILAERQRLIARQSFVRFNEKRRENEKLEAERIDREHKEAKHNLSVMYTRMWGEGRHLKEEIEKCTRVLDQERKVHCDLAALRAAAALAEPE